MCVKTKPCFWLFVLLLLFVCHRTCFSIGDDTLLVGQSLSANQTLISQNGIFELGFFKPGASLSIYLGIWYKNFADKMIVWVANRESPLNNPASSKLELSPDGILVLQTNFTKTVWSTALASSMPNNSTAQAALLDNGNFVIKDGSNPSAIYWQSFDNPTDTLLPGGKLGINKHTGKVQRLISWKTPEDPAPGQIKHLNWLAGVWNWSEFWSQPRDQAGVYGLCGVFGVFHGNSSSSCECLKGFEPLVQNDWSSGCVRKSPLQCQNKNSIGKKDGFLKMSILTLPENSKAYQKVSVARCRLYCVKNCYCVAYAYNNSGCFIWEGDLINLKQSEIAAGRAGAEIYIRLAASELEPQIGSGSIRTGGNIKWKIRTTLAVAVPVTLITLGLFIYFSCLRKGKLIHKAKERTSHNLLRFDFDADTNSTANESSSVDNRKKRWNKNIEFPLFSYESVSVATGQFSDKLGEGGFGPVYKGKLPTGLEIAVKRLSERSGQGLEEFRNETILIAKLQHRNLVRLLGSCIERDEKILIYEYMPNKSLDLYLFDANRGQILDWGTRIRIIEGIAQGLLYLHRYSRLRIIHRDLKPSNILLDSEMNPKISDFGMARIFGGNETQAHTNRIVGTYGYMSPEYAMEGLFSIKSDVFSFGVLVLEIVSGKKNTSFYHSDTLHLLGHAWKLWNSNKALDLMDPILGDPPSTATLLRYINIGLLCVQESPADRPTMSDVISMIVNEHVALPEPKQPAFVACRNMAEQRPLICSSSGVPSANNVTITAIDGR